MMWKNIKENYPKNAKLSDFSSHLGASCVVDSLTSTFLFAICFSQPLGGTPLDRFWPPGGTLGPILLLLCFFFFAKAILLQNSKIPEQQITPTTPSKKQARINEKLYRESIQANYVLLLLLKSEAPGFLESRSAELANQMLHDECYKT